MKVKKKKKRIFSFIQVKVGKRSSKFRLPCGKPNGIRDY